MPASANAGSLNRCPGARLIAWAICESGNSLGSTPTIRASSGFSGATSTGNYSFQLNFTAAQPNSAQVVDIVQGGTTPGNTYLMSTNSAGVAMGMAAIAGNAHSAFYIAVYGS